MAITREQLYSAFEEHKKKIAELKAKKYVYHVGRPCDQFGKIATMGIKQLQGAMALVKKQTAAQDDSLAELGVTAKDLGLKEEVASSFKGYTLEEWMADFKTRAEQLKDQETLAREVKATKLMKANFSDDDKFAHEMARIEGILSGDGDSDSDLNEKSIHTDAYGQVEEADDEVYGIDGDEYDYDEDDE
jgi:hypothetical protein